MCVRIYPQLGCLCCKLSEIQIQKNYAWSCYPDKWHYNYLQFRYLCLEQSYVRGDGRWWKWIVLELCLYLSSSGLSLIINNQSRDLFILLSWVLYQNRTIDMHSLSWQLQKMQTWLKLSTMSWQLCDKPSRPAHYIQQNDAFMCSQLLSGPLLQRLNTMPEMQLRMQSMFTWWKLSHMLIWVHPQP